MQVQPVGVVVPSPDGRLVVWTQTRNVIEPERSEQVTQLHLARSDGSRRIQLTRHEKGAASPAFSPDGQYVYFLSERSGKNNLFRIAVDGGEAEMLTDWKGKLAAFRLSPNGKQIALIGTDAREEQEKAKREKRDFRIVDENPEYAGLWVMPAEAAADGKRTPRRLVAGNFHIAEIDWSPDARVIAYEQRPDPGADYWTKADIGEVEVETGATRMLAATGAAESSPRYSPNGRYLAYERTSDPPTWQRSSRIVLLPREGGSPRTLPATYDEAPNMLGWSTDSRKLLLTEQKRTRHALYAMPLDGPVETLYEPAHGVIGIAAVGTGATLNSAGTHLGLALETLEEAPEAYVTAIAAIQPVRVSRANVDLPRLPLGETKLIRWRAKDGMEIEGLLTYPVEYAPGKKVPLILNIHGGPASVFSETFIGRGGIYPLAAFAARGWAVLRPNPRGSGGYGHAFRIANVNDWGGKDYEDLMAGVDHVIAMGVADPNRMAMMGWSYGGFMTSWVITQTQRFKAAAVGAGVTNLWSFTGTADIPSFLPSYFKGEPWEVFENYQKHSPMYFVKGVKTPTLILHGEADVRVPISQGYELYNALRRQGVTTKMVVYPRAPHGPREPKFILDIAQRHMEWIEKYL
jgi:dipeptidyl aminopeptidase/acylaminoacyl peptidase